MRIRREVVDAIAAHARRERPRECCGLLLGNDQEIVEAVATANTAAEPLRHYEVSPADYLAQIRKCRERATRGGPAVHVVGAYHSHPRSPPEPSPTDLEQAFPEFLFIIAGAAKDSQEVAIRGYRLEAGRFEEVQLAIEGGP
jgi:proteasome lid subunit RPN8/RPN11